MNNPDNYEVLTKDVLTIRLLISQMWEDDNLQIPIGMYNAIDGILFSIENHIDNEYFGTEINKNNDTLMEEIYNKIQNKDLKSFY